MWEFVCDKIWLKYSSQYSSFTRLKQLKMVNYMSSLLIRVIMSILSLELIITEWSPGKGLHFHKCVGTGYFLVIIFTQNCLFELIRIPEFSWDYWMHHLCVLFVTTLILDAGWFDHSEIGDLNDIDESDMFNVAIDPYYLEIMIIVYVGTGLMCLHQPIMLRYHFSPGKPIKQLNYLTWRIYIQFFFVLTCFMGIPWFLYIYRFNNMFFATRWIVPMFLMFLDVTETYILYLLMLIWKKKNLEATAFLLAKNTNANTITNTNTNSINNINTNNTKTNTDGGTVTMPTANTTTFTTTTNVSTEGTQITLESPLALAMKLSQMHNYSKSQLTQLQQVRQLQQFAQQIEKMQQLERHRLQKQQSQSGVSQTMRIHQVQPSGLSVIASDEYPMGTADLRAVAGVSNVSQSSYIPRLSQQGFAIVGNNTKVATLSATQSQKIGKNVKNGSNINNNNNNNMNSKNKTINDRKKMIRTQSARTVKWESKIDTTTQARGGGEIDGNTHLEKLKIPLEGANTNVTNFTSSYTVSATVIDSDDDENEDVLLPNDQYNDDKNKDKKNNEKTETGAGSPQTASLTAPHTPYSPQSETLTPHRNATTPGRTTTRAESPLAKKVQMQLGGLLQMSPGQAGQGGQEEQTGQVRDSGVSVIIPSIVGDQGRTSFHETTMSSGVGALAAIGKFPIITVTRATIGDESDIHNVMTKNVSKKNDRDRDRDRERERAKQREREREREKEQDQETENETDNEQAHDKKNKYKRRIRLRNRQRYKQHKQQDTPMYPNSNNQRQSKSYSKSRSKRFRNSKRSRNHQSKTKNGKAVGIQFITNLNDTGGVNGGIDGDLTMINHPSVSLNVVQGDYDDMDTDNESLISNDVFNNKQHISTSLHATILNQDDNENTDIDDDENESTLKRIYDAQANARQSQVSRSRQSQVSQQSRHSPQQVPRQVPQPLVPSTVSNGSNLQGTPDINMQHIPSANSVEHVHVAGVFETVSVGINTINNINHNTNSQISDRGRISGTATSVSGIAGVPVPKGLEFKDVDSTGGMKMISEYDSARSFTNMDNIINGMISSDGGAGAGGNFSSNNTSANNTGRSHNMDDILAIHPQTNVNFNINPSTAVGATVADVAAIGDGSVPLDALNDNNNTETNTLNEIMNAPTTTRDTRYSITQQKLDENHSNTYNSDGGGNVNTQSQAKAQAQTKEQIQQQLQEQLEQIQAQIQHPIDSSMQFINYPNHAVFTPANGNSNTTNNNNNNNNRIVADMNARNSATVANLGNGNSNTSQMHPLALPNFNISNTLTNTGTTNNNNNNNLNVSDGSRLELERTHSRQASGLSAVAKFLEKNVPKLDKWIQNKLMHSAHMTTEFDEDLADLAIHEAIHGYKPTLSFNQSALAGANLTLNNQYTGQGSWYPNANVNPNLNLHAAASNRF